MGIEHDILKPGSDEEFFVLPWRDMSNEQVRQVLVWSNAQPWWWPVYAGFAMRSTGRGVEVSDYVDKHGLTVQPPHL